jgi:hypothetical protein
MKSDEELARELNEATDGLEMSSESEYPFEVVRWSGGEMSAARLRLITVCGEETAVAETGVEDFFRVAAGEQEWKGEAELALAKRFQKLVRLLTENLSDVRVYRVGEINIGVYVVGRSSAGNWLGVSTRVVET